MCVNLRPIVFLFYRSTHILTTTKRRENHSVQRMNHVQNLLNMIGDTVPCLQSTDCIRCYKPTTQVLNEEAKISVGVCSVCPQNTCLYGAVSILLGFIVMGHDHTQNTKQTRQLPYISFISLVYSFNR